MSLHFADFRTMASRVSNDSFVFQEHVANACVGPGRPRLTLWEKYKALILPALLDRNDGECTRLRKQYVKQECWRRQLDLLKCQQHSRLAFCMDERAAHLQCLKDGTEAVNDQYPL